VELVDLAEKIGAYVSVAAAAGILLLLPLYLSQRRDIERLHAFMDRDPDHPAADLVASEGILDRAETELEEILAERGELPPGVKLPSALARAGTVAPTEVQPAAATPTPAQRVTAERPALERITMERAALEPHPRWRRFAGAVTQPRWMAAIALVAAALGVVAIFGSERLLDLGGDDARPTRAEAIEPGEVTVAVLNGTSVPGLGAKVGDDLEANGFDLGAVTNSPRQFDQTVVMFEPGQERAAQRVARDLGVRAVQPIDPPTRRLAEGAEVVVIAGEDRARP
jgi:LytR cell envelope-related transcriptional attenuator